MTTNWSKCPKFNMNPSKDIQRLENPLTNSPWQRHFDPELGAQTGAGILLLRVRRVRRGWWHLFVNSQVFTGFCQIARWGCQINKIAFQIWDLKIWQKDGLYYLYIYIYYIENMNTPCVWKLDIPPNGNFKRDDDKPQDLGPMFLTNPIKATCPSFCGWESIHVPRLPRDAKLHHPPPPSGCWSLTRLSGTRMEYEWDITWYNW